jgi:hypothetical protein
MINGLRTKLNFFLHFLVQGNFQNKIYKILQVTLAVHTFRLVAASEYVFFAANEYITEGWARNRDFVKTAKLKLWRF